MEKKINNYFYISIGQGSIYYTLRRIENGGLDSEVDYYYKNLSINKNEAISKAYKFAKENNLPLIKPNGSLIVNGKIGDLAKEKEIKKSEKIKAVLIPIPSGNSTFSKKELTDEEKAEIEEKKKLAEANKIAYENKAEKFYSDPVWAKIRKHLFWEYIHSQNCRLPDNLFIDIYHPNSLKNRKKIKWVFDNMSSNFVSEMYRNIKRRIIISGRALDIVFEIYAKKFGRRNSKDYNKVLDELYEKVSQ
jgi:hypothetical protein|tara:strand:- start:73 stop:813 length:741 start_codon:yes stop_codon:yes gene_type:complete